ncbi:hypothetical protein PTTG_26552 [Puccinia triticina 1-1 BBBD Race 1]|uniref:Uncharacterized protein n=1 Tax=Puccinia triticina (isolate 1-1 / race 1 (BBBD)) TaxID=630390 RepID=A0A180GUM1_PUCT1|nr:hypothetical protein PTTG_26552 [Puccinia triticina 1-1 BBBD Race 1]
MPCVKTQGSPQSKGSARSKTLTPQGEMVTTSTPNEEYKRPKRSTPPISKQSPEVNSDQTGSSLIKRISNSTSDHSSSGTLLTCISGRQHTKPERAKATALVHNLVVQAAKSVIPFIKISLTYQNLQSWDSEPTNLIITTKSGTPWPNFPIWQRKVKTYLAVKSLMKCIEEPLTPNASEQTKLEYVRAAAIISRHIEDNIYNHIITDENVNDAFALWKELKGEYASASVLAIYHAWRKWEDIQYNNNINHYITQLESMLAEFAAMGLDVPGTILSCTIIARILRKRPLLMETLISNAEMLSHPKQIITKMRDIAHHDAVSATMSRDKDTSASSSTALATQAQQSGN